MKQPILAIVLLILFQIFDSNACRTNLDCELNGECVTGSCLCEPAWTGPTCAILNLLPSTNTPAYRQDRTSSWGGSAIKGPDGKYHLFLAEMSFHCGLNSWQRNSVIRHATSPVPQGPYEPAEIIETYFAHNPTIIRAPDGTYLVYHIGCGDGRSNPITTCTNGTTPNSLKVSPLAECGGGSSSVLASKSLDGPWVKYDVLAPVNSGRFPFSTDNPSPYIFPDGRTLVMFRSWYGHGVPGVNQTLIGIASADSWKGPYTLPTEPIIPNNNEDPFFWRSEKGYHALFHGMYPYDQSKYAGRHAYSPDAVTWYFSPESAYTSVIHYQDGRTITFARRERPHLLFNDLGQPQFLLTGVQETWSHDYTYTHIQPIKV